MKTVQIPGTRKLMTGERIPYVWRMPVFDKAFERAAMEGGTGLCISCGQEPGYFCEPDFKRGKCPACGEMFVFGLEELVVRDWVRTPEEVQEIERKQGQAEASKRQGELFK